MPLSLRRRGREGPMALHADYGAIPHIELRRFKAVLMRVPSSRTASQMRSGYAVCEVYWLFPSPQSSVSIATLKGKRSSTRWRLDTLVTASYLASLLGRSPHVPV
jgi:hypothetical protein